VQGCGERTLSHDGNGGQHILEHIRGLLEAPSPLHAGRPLQVPERLPIPVVGGVAFGRLDFLQRLLHRVGSLQAAWHNNKYKYIDLFIMRFVLFCKLN
jgi:hypothetical protein